MSEMDDAHRADTAYEHDCRDIARRLLRLNDHPRMWGMLREECERLADRLNVEADRMVRVWD